MVICLERGADLHMAQRIPLPLTVSCSSKIQIGFTFLVSAHPGIVPDRRPLNGCVYVCDKVVQYIYVSDIEAIEACIRFLDEDDDIKIDSVSEWPSQLHTLYNNSSNKGSLVSTLNCNYKSNLLFC